MWVCVLVGGGGVVFVIDGTCRKPPKTPSILRFLMVFICANRTVCFLRAEPRRFVLVGEGAAKEEAKRFFSLISKPIYHN